MTCEREKQSVLRAKRLRRVRTVRCLRSIFCILSFPTVCCTRRQMPLIDPRLVGVIPRDAKRREQGAEFQEHRILPGTHYIGEHSPCAMIDRMPQPPRGRFGADKTPHFIYLGGASCRDAGGT